MVQGNCQHDQCKKFGKHRNGDQRLRCVLCGKTFTVPSAAKPLGTMRITMKEATTVLKMLLEGMSINAVARITGTTKPTILDLLTLVGRRAQQFWHDRMKGIECNRLEVDETWGFVGCKEKTRQRLGRSQEFGDAYTFTALDPDTKLLVSFHVGKRTPEIVSGSATSWPLAPLAGCKSPRTVTVPTAS